MGVGLSGSRGRIAPHLYDASNAEVPGWTECCVPCFDPCAVAKVLVAAKKVTSDSPVVEVSEYGDGLSSHPDAASSVPVTGARGMPIVVGVEKAGPGEGVGAGAAAARASTSVPDGSAGKWEVGGARCGQVWRCSIEASAHSHAAPLDTCP